MNPKTMRNRSAQRAVVVKALAHPSRLMIAEALAGGERCVCELTELIGADMSTASRHLTLMKSVGLIESEKRGLNVYYRLSCPCFSDFLHCVDLITRKQADALQKVAG
jgi:DNA-binding transcriptional ArsR family regulator